MHNPESWREAELQDLEGLKEGLTLSRPVFFSVVVWGRGRGCCVWGGWDSPLLHNFASIKAMTMRLGGEKERPKIFLLRSTTRSEDVG